MTVSSASRASETGQQVIIVMGVTGCGKSSLGREVARCLEAPFLEGDEFHPPENIEKMSAAIPLCDEDRVGWLQALGEEIKRHADAGKSVVTSCSALKKKYRQQLNTVSGHDILYIFMDGSHELISERLSGRKGHYMPPSLLTSQFEALEPPTDDENVLRVDIRTTIEAMCAEVMRQLQGQKQPA